MKQLGIGFFGAGVVANLHAEAVRRCAGARLVGLWNRTPQRAEEKARAYGCERYGSVDDLLGDPAIDAVHVLTNLESHHELTLRALAAGKHVLVEKPVSVTVAEIEEMAARADAAGLVCMPGHNYIYEDGVRRAGELIAGGALGRLITVYVLYNIHHAEQHVRTIPGVIRQILTHHAYILLFLAGRPVELSAMKATLHYESITQEDIALVNLRMGSGALAHLQASFAADDHSADPWTVLVKAIGTDGATRYSYRDWVENKPAEVHSQTYSAYPYSIYREVEHFVAHVRDGGPPPLSTMADAVDAQRIVEAAERSADSGQLERLK